MNLQEQINNHLKNATLDKNEVSKTVLRQLKAAFQNFALGKGNVNTEISDLDTLAIIRKAIQQRKDSIEAFTKGNRNDLVEKEQAEIEVLAAYLPKEMPEQELNDLIDAVIKEFNATSKKEMGGVIKSVVSKVNGRAENRTISMKVAERLS